MESMESMESMEINDILWLNSQSFFFSVRTEFQKSTEFHRGSLEGKYQEPFLINGKRVNKDKSSDDKEDNNRVDQTPT